MSKAKITFMLLSYDPNHPPPTVSAVTQTGSEEDGTLAKNEVMRWALNYVGEGVTVRLCVTKGKITFYVAQNVRPNKEMNDNQSTVASTGKLAVDCGTIPIFQELHHKRGTDERDRRQEENNLQLSTLYLSVEGHDTLNTFFLQSGDGNVTFGELFNFPA